MSGEGVIAARPPAMPHEHSRIDGRPGVVTRLCSDGEHRVCLLLGGQQDPQVWDVDTAERIGRELLEYAALVRDKIGLSCGPNAALLEAGAGGKVFP